MPELPDVEGFRRYFDRHAAGRRIERLEADRDIVRNSSPQGLGRALTGRRFDRPERHGKWLICPAGKTRLLLHFGMSGRLVWSGQEPESHPHDRLTLGLDGGDLRYRSQRKLGGAWLVRAGQDVEDVTGPIGPDAMALEEGALAELVGRGKGAVKSALMNQKLVSGLGNITVDEILWDSRTDPRRDRTDLSEAALKELEQSAHRVLQESARHGRVPDSRGWLTSQRGASEPTCPRCGTGLRTPKVGGRTTYLCPRCQS